MVLDKSIEALEDLVRFLNRKQSFYFKLYDRYLEGDYDHLDDSRKHEADCDSVCDDIVECIKAISDEAQIRGVAKKPKVLCTLDGQDEEKYILDEWLLKVVRLLNSELNWNRMLAPVEGKDMNNAFDAILFRLTYVANSLKELSNKTEQEYYGGRRTDVMPYYIGESKECFMSESDKAYKAKAGKKWLKGDKLVKSKAAADSFESKTEPTQRLNQMKKDGKLDKDVNIDVVEESIFDFAAQNQPMYRFAKQKHDATGVIRKHSGDPYWVHPEGVAKIAAAYGGTDIEIQAAMAHDTLEDTNCSYDELEEMFGDEVASIVREITNDTEEVDRLGKEQYINLELISLSHPALFVKLCDMYYNQMDFPTEAQKRRMTKNINYLLANREDDLNENEIALIEAILQNLLN